MWTATRDAATRFGFAGAKAVQGVFGFSVRIIAQHWLAMTIVVVASCVLAVAVFFVRFPFWARQPVLHTYDVTRQIWMRTFAAPFVIQTAVPAPSKFVDPARVASAKYADVPPARRTEIADFIQCNSVQSDRVVVTAAVPELDAELADVADAPAWISVARAVPGAAIEGCVTSRALDLFVGTNVCVGAYLIDHFVTRRGLSDTNATDVSRRLLQTHEARTRRASPGTTKGVSVSVIRTLGAPFAGVVPLVEFETALFFLKNIRIPSLPHGVRLDGGGALSANAEVLRAAMADAAALPPPLAFAALAPPGAALAATRHGSLLTYSLMRGGRTCATYVFRDVYAHHEDADGCALALVASLRSKEVPLEVFYIGFLNALGAAARLGSGFSRASRKGRKVRAGVPFKALAIDALGANTQLLARWRAAGQREHAVGRGAIYLYNFVHPRMPLRAEECVCIW